MKTLVIQNLRRLVVLSVSACVALSLFIIAPNLAVASPSSNFTDTASSATLADTLPADISATPQATTNYKYKGSRYYYNVLATKNFGTQMQAIYNFLLEEADKLQTDLTTDFTSDVYLTIDMQNFFTSAQPGQFTLEEYDTVLIATNAFSDDNEQYFFLNYNLGAGANFWESTIEFMSESKGGQSYNYRYAADRKKHSDMVDATYATYQNLVRNATSKYEVARLIHDKMVSDYDYSSDPFDYAVHYLVGTMGVSQNGTVCEGYSKMYSFMANNLGLEAVFVSGSMLASEGFPAGGHAWNLVEMDDGKYYFMDSTWADNQTTDYDVGNFRNPINYRWFLLGHTSGAYEAKHGAGVQDNFTSPYVLPTNIGGDDYDYKAAFAPRKFLTDISATRSNEYNLGTFVMPTNGVLDINPLYYDQTLVKGVDYDIEYEMPLKLGKNRVWFIGKGMYSGVDFGVVNLVASISGKITATVAQFTGTTFDYTGQPITPDPVVKNGNTRLKQGVDYTVTYLANTAIGTAKARITCLGVYECATGMQLVERSFQIVQPAAPPPNPPTPPAPPALTQQGDLAVGGVSGKTYGDAQFALALDAAKQGSGNGSITYSCTAGCPSVATVSNIGYVAIKGAGSFTVTATRASNGTYDTKTSDPLTISIAKKVLTPSVTVSSKVYDGNQSVGLAQVTSVLGQAQGVVAGDTFTHGTDFRTTCQYRDENVSPSVAVDCITQIIYTISPTHPLRINYEFANSGFSSTTAGITAVPPTPPNPPTPPVPPNPPTPPVPPSPQTVKTPAYRCAKYQGGYFYTTNIAEYNTCETFSMRPEGFAFYITDANTPGAVAVYRSAKLNGSGYFYTTNVAEYKTVSQYGMRPEGFAFYALPAGNTTPGARPLYRGAHLINQGYILTASLTEYHNALPANGYRKEGEAFRVF